MIDTFLRYQMPAHGTVDESVQSLGDALPLEREDVFDSRRCFYDSFDWRLYERGWMLQLETVDRRSTLALERLDGGERVSCAVATAPRFASDLPKPIRKRIGPLLEMRALLPRADVRSECRRFSVTNSDGKTVLRISFDQD
ncbi:MAG: hypothetical protein ABFS02_08640, partial [Pseudomonadota bacterium]